MMPAPTSVSYTRLIEWLSEYEGFQSSLVCRDVPGAGRGMFASRDIAGGEPILTIPAEALLNPLTLRSSPLNRIPTHLFPLRQRRTSTVSMSSTASASSSTRLSASPTKKRRLSKISTRLNTTQLLTLHLLLTREESKRYPSAWAVYLATLPEFAGWHPLTWPVGDPATEGDEPRKRVKEEAMLHYLPPNARRKVQEVRGRYEEDCLVLQELLSLEDPFASENVLDGLTESDFQWAWLNVNTRTVSIPLNIPGPASLQNHTLVPLLDMLNHTSSPDHQIPTPRQISSAQMRAKSASICTRARGSVGGDSGDRRGPQIPGKVGFRLIAPRKGLQEGEEVLFEYGHHSSATLFAEYGFVERPPVPNLIAGLRGGTPGSGKVKAAETEVKLETTRRGWLCMPHGSVDLGDLVQDLWRGLEAADAEEKEGVLHALSSWDQNIIHTTPHPPHPSHALLMTLRLLHLPANSPKLRSIRTGQIYYISPANEQAVLATLGELCRIALERASKGLKAVSQGKQGRGSRGALPGVDSAVWGEVELLWAEEVAVLTALRDRVDNGDTDW